MVNFVALRFEKLAFSQRICEKMVFSVDLDKWDLKSWHSDKKNCENGVYKGES